MKTVLITGISKGIGQGLTKKFIAEGYKVIGTSTSGEISLTDSNLTVYQLDLSQSASIQTCTEAIKNNDVKSGVKIDILINNAGILADEDETMVKIEKLRQTLEVNLIGTIDLTERLLETMNDSSHIINISSSAGSLARTVERADSHFPNHYPAYKISKCALNMYTRTLALRLKHDSADITVSAVHPGWVKTDMGGQEAPITIEESADKIFEFAITRPESGKFWFEGKEMEW